MSPREKALAVLACVVHHPHLDAAERAALGVALAGLQRLADDATTAPAGVLDILTAVVETIDATEGPADVATCLELVCELLTDHADERPTTCLEVGAVPS